jgi:hypothetical protein
VASAARLFRLCRPASEYAISAVLALAIAFAAGIGLAGAPGASATPVNGLLIGHGASVVDPVEQVGVPGVPGWRWRRRGSEVLAVWSFRASLLAGLLGALRRYVEGCNGRAPAAVSPY